jgi:hypothetical protein
MAALGAAELTESLGSQAIDDISRGHYIPLLEFNLHSVVKRSDHVDLSVVSDKSAKERRVVVKPSSSRITDYDF